MFSCDDIVEMTVGFRKRQVDLSDDSTARKKTEEERTLTCERIQRTIKYSKEERQKKR